MTTSHTVVEVSPSADLANRVLTYFEGVHRKVFNGDPVSNPRLRVEIAAHDLAHDTPVVTLIAPWTLIGIAAPPDGLMTTSLRIGPNHYPVLGNEVADIGRYFSVILVPDVSEMSSQEAAQETAAPLAVQFSQAVARARMEMTEVEDHARRASFKRIAGGAPPAERATGYGNPHHPPEPKTGG